MDCDFYDKLFKKYGNFTPINECGIGVRKWKDSYTNHITTEIKNTEIKNEISECRDVITNLVKKSFNVDVFPNVTTLVMWKEGKSMSIHKDNGYENDKSILHMRKYTTVMGINI
jgi:hypothetical protein